MANTFEAIATVTVGSGGAADIEFTSIPATYTDLYVLLSARSNRANVQDWVKVQFNSSTTNYSWRGLIGDGSSVSSENNTSAIRMGRVPGANATASTFGNCSLYIPNYASSNYKSASADGVGENNATEAWSALDANLWSDTSAITSIKLLPADGTAWTQYSTATLYGIKNS
jgi:hypothetical protein